MRRSLTSERCDLEVVPICGNTGRARGRRQRCRRGPGSGSVPALTLAQRTGQCVSEARPYRALG
eukprot:13554874-Alexandrium_andersonii.AAC.1